MDQDASGPVHADHFVFPSAGGKIVRHGVNGLLVEPGSAVDLASAIGRLLDSRELRAACGKAGREIVQKEFSEAIVVERTLELYRTMLGGAWPAIRLSTDR